MSESRRDVLAAIAVLAGLFWAIVQAAFTSVARSQTYDSMVDCGVEASKAAFTLATVGVCVAALLALLFAVARRPVLSMSLIGVEGVLVLVWIATDGSQAASCAIE
jgi:hypothetical protein